MTLVLVVDDSKFMRTVLGNTLQDYGYSVVEASNGEEAVAAVEQYDPDVVTMDVEMPKMNGLEATEAIMEKNPVPILMLSAHTNDGADTTLDALQRGAVDFISKPDGKETPITAVEFGQGLVDKLEAVARADVGEISDSIPEEARPEGATPITDTESRARDVASEKKHAPVIVIGASTGGPSIVENIMTKLPKNLDAYVFIVQHMPEGFTGRFAERLDRVSEYDVTEAEDGLEVAPGEAVVAKGDKDMIVNDEPNGIIIETQEASNNGTSSISTTLKTAADQFEPPIVAALLTGMGDDGSDALEAFKDAGGHVIAQNEETSPVFGIPRRAIQTGNVDEVLGDYDLVNGIVEGVDASDPNNGDTQ